jgi:hypothetical protein
MSGAAGPARGVNSYVDPGSKLVSCKLLLDFCAVAENEAGDSELHAKSRQQS